MSLLYSTSRLPLHISIDRYMLLPFFLLCSPFLPSCLGFFLDFPSFQLHSPPAMASAALKQQLDGLLNSMFRDGLLDDQFTQLQMLQDPSTPGFVAEVITMFCEDSDTMLEELTKLLDQQVVDFGKVDGYVHQMKGSSSSVGAQHIKQACIEFRCFCENNDKDGCLRALHVIKHEYYLLRSKFKTMMQLEEKIQAYDAIHQKSS